MTEMARDSTNDLDDDGDNILDGFDACPVGQQDGSQIIQPI